MELWLKRAERPQRSRSPLFHTAEVGQGAKNVAGWLIAAIENTYELPDAYVEAKVKAQEVRRG